MSELNVKFFFILNNWAGQSTVLDRIIVFFADRLAYVYVIIALGILFFWKTSLAKKIQASIGAFITLFLARGVFVELIRFFYVHPRPMEALTGVHELLTETSSSFPSGHATFFFALSTYIYGYDRKMGWGFFILSAAMGFARVVAGVHYPLDILGGAILGVCIGLAVFKTVDKFYKNTVV